MLLFNHVWCDIFGLLEIAQQLCGAMLCLQQSYLDGELNHEGSTLYLIHNQCWQLQLVAMWGVTYHTFPYTGLIHTSFAHLFEKAGYKPWRCGFLITCLALIDCKELAVPSRDWHANLVTWNIRRTPLTLLSHFISYQYHYGYIVWWKSIIFSPWRVKAINEGLADPEAAFFSHN